MWKKFKEKLKSIPKPKKATKALAAVLVTSVIGIVGCTTLLENIDKNNKPSVEVVNAIDIDVHVETKEKQYVRIEKNNDGNKIDIYIEDIPGNNVNDNEENIYEPKEVRITSESGLNVREKESVNSDKVGVFEYGEVVKVFEETDKWYKTDLGFIYRQYTTEININ